MTTLVLVPSAFEFDRLDTDALPSELVLARCGVGLVHDHPNDLSRMGRLPRLDRCAT